MKLRQPLTEKAFWGLLLIPILYFYRSLFLGETVFVSDLFLNFLPQKRLLADLIHSGTLPLWDPYLHGGQPYIGNIMNAAFYPFNIFYAFLPYIRAFNLILILHVMLSCAGAYMFARVIGLTPAASFMVGAINGLCGYALSLLTFPNLLFALSYFPLLLLFWHLFLRDDGGKWFALTAIFGVIHVLPGAPEFNIFTILMLFGWSLAYPYIRVSAVRRIGLWLLLIVCILGMAAAQLFPTIEMAAQSSRSQGRDFKSATQWSLYPGRLPELIFPYFLGYGDTLNLDDYWGRNVVSEEAHTPMIASIYFGGIALFFAIVGGFSRKREPVVPFTIRRYFLAAILGAITLSLGRFLPFACAVFSAIPALGMFRFPIKFLAVGIFPLAMLTGYASECYFRGDAAWSRSLYKAFWGIFCVLIGLTVLFFFSDDFAEYFQSLFFKISPSPTARNGLIHSFGYAAALWGILVILYFYRRVQPNRWQQWMLAGIVLMDLLIAGRRVNPYSPEDVFTAPSALANTVHRELGGGRFFRSETPRNYGLHAQSNEVAWLYFWYAQTLADYSGVFYRIPMIFHRDLNGLGDLRLVRLKELIDVLPAWEQRLPLLSAGAITVFISSDEISIPGVQRIAEVPNLSTLHFYVYRNERAMPRTAFVSRWYMVNSEVDAVNVMLNPSYDPHAFVTLEIPKPLFSWSFSTPPAFDAIPPNMRQSPADARPCDSQIEPHSSQNASTQFGVSTACDGYLVFSEPFYPGWKVTIDGKPAQIFRANSAFSAVFLPAGSHRIHRYYLPMSLIAGVITSTLFFLLLTVISFNGWFRQSNAGDYRAVCQRL